MPLHCVEQRRSPTQLDDDVEQEGDYTSIWQEAPDSILLHLFSFLEARHLLTVSEVCKVWRRVALDESLWRGLLRGRLQLPDTVCMAPGRGSWRGEYRRIYYHSPTVLTETLTDHTDEVLHVSFAHRGHLFSTTSKDATLRIWSVGCPTTLKYTKDFRELLSWDFTQFSCFNESDTLVLVSSVKTTDYMDRRGYVAILSLSEGFEIVRMVTMDPSQLFGAWLDDSTFLGGCLEISLDRFATTVQIEAYDVPEQSTPLEDPAKPLAIEEVSGRPLFTFSSETASLIKFLTVADTHFTLGNSTATKLQPLPERSDNICTPKCPPMAERFGNICTSKLPPMSERFDINNSPKLPPRPDTLDTYCTPKLPPRPDTLDTYCTPKLPPRPDTLDTYCTPKLPPRPDTLDMYCTPKLPPRPDTLDTYCTPKLPLTPDTLYTNCTPQLHPFIETECPSCSGSCEMLDLQLANQSSTRRQTGYADFGTQTVAPNPCENVTTTHPCENVTFQVSYVKCSTAMDTDEVFVDCDTDKSLPVAKLGCSDRDTGPANIVADTSDYTSVIFSERAGDGDIYHTASVGPCVDVATGGHHSTKPAAGSSTCAMASMDSNHDTTSPLTNSCKSLIFVTGEFAVALHQLGFKNVPPYSPDGPILQSPDLDDGQEGFMVVNYSNNDIHIVRRLQSPDKPDNLIDLFGHVTGLCLSHDQRYLFINCRPWIGEVDRTDPWATPDLSPNIEIRVIDLLTMTDTGQRYVGHKGFSPSTMCCFVFLDVSRDYVASGSEDAKGYLWDTHYQVQLANFAHESGVVNAVGFNPQNQEYLVTVSDDGTIKVWRSRYEAKLFAQQQRDSEHD